MLWGSIGGGLCADDEEIAAKVIVAAGGYEKFYMSHIACPGGEVFERIEPLNIPNYSIRMSSLTAATIRPQIKELPERVAHANKCYDRVCDRLMDGVAQVRPRTVSPRCLLFLPARLHNVAYMADSSPEPVSTCRWKHPSASPHSTQRSGNTRTLSSSTWWVIHGSRC